MDYTIRLYIRDGAHKGTLTHTSACNHKGDIKEMERIADALNHVYRAYCDHKVNEHNALPHEFVVVPCCIA